MEIIRSIQNRIYVIREERVMLDFDLAHLYEVETKALNQAVKRNLKRFPRDFMFRLSLEEWRDVRSQSVTASESKSLGSQIVTASQNKRKSNITPYAFTEQGIAMLSGIINSEKAINMNIAVMRAFVAIRKIVLLRIDEKQALQEIEQRINEHDVQLSQIYDTIENLLDDKAAEKKWDEREKIVLKNNPIKLLGLQFCE